MRALLVAMVSVFLGVGSLGQLPLPEGAIARLGFPLYEQAAFSPDGERIFVLTSIGVETLEAEGLDLEGFRPFFRPSALAVSPDGRLIAVADDTGVQIFELPGWTKRATVGIGRTVVRNLSFSPAAAHLAVVYGDTVGVWNMETGRWERRFTAERSLLWSQVEFIDEHSLIIGDERQGLFYWEFTSDLPRKIAGFTANPRLALSRTWAAIQEKLGGPVAILDVRTGEKRFEIPGCGPIALTPDGTRIAVIRNDVYGVIQVFDIGSVGPHPVIDVSVSAFIKDLYLSDKGDALLVSVVEESETKKAALISFSIPAGVSTGQHTGYRAYTSEIAGIAFSPSGRLIGLATSLGVEIWQDGRLRGFSRVVDNSGPITFIDENTLLVVGFRDSSRVVGILNWQEHSFVELWRGNPFATPFSISLSPQGDLFAIGYKAGTRWDMGRPPATVGLGKAGLVEVYSVPDGGKVCSFEAHPGSSVLDLGFSPDGNLIATVDDAAVKVWESRTGQLLAESSTPRPPCAFALDSQSLVCSTSTDEKVEWDFLKDGQNWITVLLRESADLLLISPDGQYLYLVENFGSGFQLSGPAIHIWDLKQRRELRTLAAPHGELISSVAISPDGGLLVTGSYDGTALVWDVASLLGINRQPVAEFSFQPAQVRVGEPVRFVDESTDVDGVIVKWRWEFGDGRVSEARNPTITYASPGSYTVRLTVMDDQGATATKEHVVVVRENEPPEAYFRFLPPDPRVFEEVWFIDESHDPDGQLVSWEWDFGDGEGSERPSPRHRYVRAGSYEVVLRVTDDSGKEARKEIILGVAPVSYVLGLPEQVGSRRYLIWVAPADREVMAEGTKIKVIRREVMPSLEVRETVIGRGTVVLRLSEQAVIEVEESASEIRIGDQIQLDSD